MLQLSANALVITLLVNREAALAVVAVEEVLSASNSADSTAFAVEDLLLCVVVVPEFAHVAVVAGELDFAVSALVRSRLDH